MFQLSATVRIAVGLTCLGVSVLLTARMLGLDQGETAALQGRESLCESVAIQCTTAKSYDLPLDRLRRDLQAVVDRTDKLLSVGVRVGQELVVEAGPHRDHWSSPDRTSGQSNITRPVFSGDLHWGNLELRFAPLRAAGVSGMLRDLAIWQTILVALVSSLLFTLYLRKMLTHLDPSKVVPDRVRAALDTLAEGMLVLDRNHRIVLANRAFAENMKDSAKSLQGRHMGELPWQRRTNDEALPWEQAREEGQAQLGATVDLQITDDECRTYLVNASPIVADSGVRQGVIVSFDDVTLNEQRKVQLEQALGVLAASREKIQQQNEKLKVLATRDPLTGCLNRRSFFEDVEAQWIRARSDCRSMACIMVDVDHFKSINDRFGHSVGDEVLRGIGRYLQETADSSELLCRYGGEEFCLVVPDSPIEAAYERADELRQQIQQQEFGTHRITASMGVAAGIASENDFQELLERADHSLYVAKRRGRNRVARYDQVRDPIEAKGPSKKTETAEPSNQDAAIPFHAVTALISALSYRDAATAEHSRRVADLCVTAAAGKLTIRELYVLETAALLHDIGKIGVPDSILLKPGPLDDEEWQLMGLHDRMGVEIVKTTFSSRALVEIIKTHHAWYGGHPRHSHLPKGDDIPLAARILAISDAYDAMVSDRTYRRGRSQDDAFNELRRCGGQQFDPQLVECFIASLQDHRDSKHLPSVPKQTALRIGLQVERLTDALDTNDLQGVMDQAACLRSTALESELPEIARLASELETIAADHTEVTDLIQITANLLDLCRTTQKAYLEVDDKPRALREHFAARSFQEDK